MSEINSKGALLLAKVRNYVLNAYVDLYLRRFLGMHIAPGAKISLRARLDKNHAKGIHIGRQTYISANALILTHDHVQQRVHSTHIGANCFIGYGAIILPGLNVGDSCIVAAGSVVTKDVPQGSIVAGNPASIKKSGITLGKYGVLTDA